MGLYVESTQNKTDLLYIITTQLEQSLKINNEATYALWWISPVKGSEFFCRKLFKKAHKTNRPIIYNYYIATAKLENQQCGKICIMLDFCCKKHWVICSKLC